MATRKEKVDAGLFLLIGVLLFGGTIAVVAGLNLERSGDVYLIKIPKSVGALREGSIVKYLGVNVGRVKSVEFPAEDVESVRVSVEITRASTPIKSGTFATLTSNFLTGETSIELQGGANDEARLLAGSLIPWRPSTFMRLEDSLPGVLDELRHVVARLGDLLDAENRERVARMIDDFDALAVDLRGQVGPLGEEVRALRQSLADAGDRIAAAAVGLRADVDASLGSGIADLKSAARSVEGAASRLSEVTGRIDEGAQGLPALVASIRRVAERLDRVLASTDTMVDENRDGLRRTLARFESSAREFEELLDRLERDPSDLLFASPPDERERGARSGGKPAKGGGP